MENYISIWFAAVSTCLVSFVYYNLNKFSFWRQRNIPGPMPVPFLGTNIYYMFKNKIDLEAEWRQTYGHTYGTYDSYRPILRSTDNELLKHVFVTNPQSFMNRDNVYVHNKTKRTWLLWSEDQEWAWQRAMIAPSFTSAKMRSMIDTIGECVKRFIDHVDARINHNDKSEKASGEEIDKSDLSVMSLDVIAQAFFGLKKDFYSNKADDFMRGAYSFATISIARLISLLFMPALIARIFRFDLVKPSSFAYYDQLGARIVSERRKQMQQTARNGNKQLSKAGDIVQRLIEAEYKPDDEANNTAFGGATTKTTKSFTDEEIIGQMTFMFLAGFETTAAALSFSMLELSQQPHVQKLLYDELVAKFGENNRLFELLKEGHVSYDDLMSLTQLDAFVSEVLRLYPPAFDQLRLVSEPGGVVLPTKDFGDIYLPRGTPIAHSIYLTQRDPDYFDQPNRFDMARFYPDNRKHIKPCTYSPFSMGPRHCVGSRLALLEVKYALACLLSKYVVETPIEPQRYPPTFKQHLFFLQAQQLSFRFIPR